MNYLREIERVRGLMSDGCCAELNKCLINGLLEKEHWDYTEGPLLKLLELLQDSEVVSVYCFGRDTFIRYFTNKLVRNRVPCFSQGLYIFSENHGVELDDSLLVGQGELTRESFEQRYPDLIEGRLRLSDLVKGLVE